LLLAFVIVVVLAAVAARYPGIWFRLADPAASLERLRTQRLHAVASADAPLSLEQARDLLRQYRAGTYAASVALVGQDRKHGLPEAFVAELRQSLVDERGRNPRLTDLIARLAAHRPFGEDVERALADSIRPGVGAPSSQAIGALGHIGAHRALTEDTLSVLLDLAAARSWAPQAALAAIEKTAAPFGLPEWALARLEQIAAQRPGARNDAIRAIGAAGARERALALLNTQRGPRVAPAAVAQALHNDDVPQLLAVLRDESMAPAVRAGALDRIVKRRDQSELVGEALTEAFASNEPALRLAAFATFGEWGRHHSRHIAVSWTEVCARAFDEDDPAIRARAIAAVRFVPFPDRAARDEFFLQVLAGSPRQQGAALAALSRERRWSEPVKQAAGALTAANDADVAAQARHLAQRLRPPDPWQQRRKRLGAALLWGLLLLPAVTAIGFETYFVARLLQSLAARRRYLVPLLVSVGWFALSVALGLLLFVGVLAMHGGTSVKEVLIALGVINLVFAAIGWLLSRATRSKPAPDTMTADAGLKE
jgi:hypothetical protein